MMGEIEAIGDAVTGGLLARAVEPGAGEVGSDGHTHEKCCLNCGIAADRTLLRGLRAKGAYPPLPARIRRRFPCRPDEFRRKVLANPADAGLAAG